MIVLLFLLISVFATSASGSSPPREVLSYDELFEALPEQVQTLITQLTPEDIDVLQSLRANFSEIVDRDPIAFENKILAMIKTKSAPLGSKMQAALDSWNRTMGSLSAEARNFFEEANQKLRTTGEIASRDIGSLIGVFRSIFTSEQRLSLSAKDEVKKVFPAINMIFEDANVKKFFEETEKMTPEQLTKTIFT